MSANTFGQHFSITTFGESHGTALGVVIDGCPAGVEFDRKLLTQELERRRPGLQILTSARQEPDVPEILSGVFEGKTLGTPIAMIVRNQDQRSQDYKEIKDNPRIGHSDDLWKLKFGHSDHRGGGRASGRETVTRVMAGAVAQMFVKKVLPEYKAKSIIREIGPLQLKNEDYTGDPEVVQLLTQAQSEGKSYGGLAELQLMNVPAGLGEPVFHKLKADLAAALMSVGATSGVEIGEGFASTHAQGTDFHKANSEVYGGIRGGISTGETIHLKVAFKPTSSVLDVAKKGRHDPCIVIRALPVIEAMAHLVIADHLLWSRLNKI